jgi:hypothetical protein
MTRESTRDIIARAIQVIASGDATDPALHAWAVVEGDAVMEALDSAGKVIVDKAPALRPVHDPVLRDEKRRARDELKANLADPNHTHPLAGKRKRHRI